MNSSILAVVCLATKAIPLLGAGEAKGLAVKEVLFKIPALTAISGNKAMPKPDSTICTRVNKLVASTPS